MARFVLALAAFLSFVSTTIAAFSATSKNNVAIYWGQGAYQARLIETCKNPNVDIVILGFVNVFPDQDGSGGYPGTNFGNACGSATFKNKTGGATQLLSSCKYIGPDITECQKTYGKKILLSFGGAYPPTYFIASNAHAVSFAQFMWGAFGPITYAWHKANGPRPFGDAVVDGFDFDIESQTVPTPTYNGKAVDDYKTRGYASMIMEFKNNLFPLDTTKHYYISGAPQCVVPDQNLGPAVEQAWFDFLFIQFYNTRYCSARTGVEHIKGQNKNDISFNTWANVNFYNKNVLLYIGLVASTNASSTPSYYLYPGEAQILLKKFYPHAKFGGVMLWEATHAANNVFRGKAYTAWIKQILTAIAGKTTVNLNPTISASKDGTCGPNYGTTCKGTKFGGCCNDGTCVSSNSTCESSCDSRYSNCTTTNQRLLQLQLKKRQAVSVSAGASGEANIEAGGSTGGSTAASSSTATSSTGTPVSSSSFSATVTPEQVSSLGPTSYPTVYSVPPVTGSAESSQTSSAAATPLNIAPLVKEESTTTSDTVSTTPMPTTSSGSPSLSATSTYGPFTASYNVSSTGANSTLPTQTATNVTLPAQTPTDLTSPPLTVHDHHAEATAAALVNDSTTAADPTTEPSTEAPDATTSSDSIKRLVTKSTKTETIFSTVTRTQVENKITSTFTTVEPVSTTTVVVDVTVTVTENAAPAPTTADVPMTTDITTTTVTSCDSTDPSCTSSRKTLTVVVTTTILAHATVTVPPAMQRKKKTTTLYTTEVVTTVIEVAYNPDATLYNPHSNSISTRTEHTTRTETINTTVTVTPMTTTDKSTTTVFEYVTIMPVAVQAKNKDGQVVGGDKAKSGEPSLATGAVTASGSLAAAASGPLQQTTSAAGRVSPRDGGKSAYILVAGLCLALLVL